MCARNTVTLFHLPAHAGPPCSGLALPGCGTTGPSVVLEALPHSRIALEARSERDLPDAVALAQTALNAVGRHRPALALTTALIAILGDQLELVPATWPQWNKGEGTTRVTKGRRTGSMEERSYQIDADDTLP